MFLASHNNFFSLPIAQFPKLVSHSVFCVCVCVQHSTCIIDFYIFQDAYISYATVINSSQLIGGATGFEDAQ